MKIRGIVLGVATLGSLFLSLSASGSTGTALTVHTAPVTFDVKLTASSGGAIVFDATNNGTGVISSNLDLGGKTRTIRVGPNINLQALEPGDEVVLEVTRAVAVNVKPA